MKKGALVLLFALVVGGIVATLMARDAGYVLLVYGGMSVETSLWFALFVLIVVWFVLRLLFGVLRRVMSAGSGMRGWNRARRVRQAHEQTLRGLSLLAEGEWSGARSALLGAVAHAELPFVNYLGAARAAHELGEDEARDRLLAHAREVSAGSALAVQMTDAELRMGGGDFAGAEPILARLHAEAPRQALVTKRLLECRQRLGDHAGVIELDKELRRHKVLPESQIEDVMRHAWCGRLASAGAEDIESVWRAVPKQLRTDEALVINAARVLDKSGKGDDAEDALRSLLKSNWSAAAVEAYGRLVSADAASHLKHAESFAKAHGDDAALLVALGRIALRAGATDKAKAHLEDSLRTAPSADAYGVLGRVHLASNEHDDAAACFARQIELGEGSSVSAEVRS